MPNLQSMYLLKRMSSVTGLDATPMVVLFLLGIAATTSILNLIKMALHMALENGAARIAIYIIAGKKILLFVLYYLRLPHALLHLSWSQM